MTTKSPTATRAIVRSYAEDHGLKYRITKDGQIDFYGTMPSTNQTGWYLGGHILDDLSHLTPVAIDDRD